MVQISIFRDHDIPGELPNHFLAAVETEPLLQVAVVDPLSLDCGRNVELSSLDLDINLVLFGPGEVKKDLVVGVALLEV